MRWLLLAIAIVFAAPTFAQGPIDFKLSANEVYRHKPSGLVLPLMLDGLPRIRAQAFSPDQLDEAINFGTPDLNEDLTVFVYRNVTGAVPVWFDRSATAAEHRAMYGGLTALRPATAFTPPGQANASGLIVAYRTGKGPYRSTALALLPLGPGWYIVFRYSSQTVDAAALDGRLRSLIAAVGWPKKIAAQPQSVPITYCPTSLAFSGPAKAIDRSKVLGGSLLFGALLSSADDDTTRKMDKDTVPAAPITWCRDIAASAGLANAAVYRPIGTTDRYLIAFQDAGRGVMVEPDGIAALLGKTSKPDWSITQYDIAFAMSFVARDRLPAPDQILKIISSEEYASKAATWGEKRNVQINGDMLK